MSKPLCIALIALCIGFAGSAAAAGSETAIKDSANTACDGDHAAADLLKCLGEHEQLLQQQMATAYSAAEAAFPEQDNEDVRKTRKQLKAAQDAWQAYSIQHCAVEGGLEGGMNLWVSIFASRCYIDETKRRTAYLRALAKDAAADPAPKAATQD